MRYQQAIMLLSQTLSRKKQTAIEKIQFISAIGGEQKQIKKNAKQFC